MGRESLTCPADESEIGFESIEGLNLGSNNLPSGLLCLPIPTKG